MIALLCVSPRRCRLVRRTSRSLLTALMSLLARLRRRLDVDAEPAVIDRLLVLTFGAVLGRYDRKVCSTARRKLGGSIAGNR